MYVLMFIYGPDLSTLKAESSDGCMGTHKALFPIQISGNVNFETRHESFM